MIVAEDIAPLLAALDEMAENVDTLRRYAQALHSSLPAAEPAEETEASKAAASPPWTPRCADEGWIAGATHSPTSPAPALPPVLIVPAGAPAMGVLPELPPDAPRAPAALSGRQKAYFDLIRERAEMGGPTPGSDDFRNVTGADGSYRTLVERALVARGLIIVHGRRHTKVYELVSTGQRTVACDRTYRGGNNQPRVTKPARAKAVAPAARAAPAAPPPATITRQAAPPSAPWATWRAPVVYRKPRSTPPVGAGGKLF